MQYSVGVEYSLHCLLYLVGQPLGESITIRDLAKFQGISETYLSKAFTKLSKKGIIRSSTGVKGGYQLARNPENISFWDVIEAIEGDTYNFKCNGILRKIVIKEPSEKDTSLECPCLIKDVMFEAEEVMRNYLRSKSLMELHLAVKEVTTEEYQNNLKEWFKKAKLTR